KNRLSGRHWSARLRLDPLEERRVLAVSWDGGGDGTSFSDRFNWNTDQVPTATDDAVINLGSSTIVANGSVTVKSLSSVNAFSITAGVFTVTANSSVNNFQLAGATFIASGSGVTFSASGTTTLSDSNLTASAGASISLPNLTSVTSSAGNISLTATG